MSQLSLNNKYIAEALSPEQRKKAQEILDKESGADKRKEQAAAARERSERRKDKEIELKQANLKIRQDREKRRSQADDQRKAAREKSETVKKAKEYGDKAKTSLQVKREVVTDKDGDGTALGKVGSNVGRTAAGVGKAIYNKVKEREEKKKIKEESNMKNVPAKDREVIKQRGKNLFKKDLTGSVMNANESADASANPEIKSQQKKQDMIKKRVLQAKLRAVRSGGGDSITASYNPETTVISEVDGDSKNDKLDKVINIMKGKNKIEVNPQVKAEEYTVTNADKKGNTSAWKGYKSGKKNVKTGKPLYKAADHVKEHHTKDKDGKVIEHEDTTPSSVEEGLVDMVKKGAKRHSKAVEKKKIKNRKAVPYAALGASYQPEGEVIDEKKKGLDGKECWDGYKLAGTKKKGGKTVDNCVKVKEDYHSGTGEKVQKRTLAWMRKKGQKGAPGLDAMKERQKEHEEKRGVKEEAGSETKKIEKKGKKKIDPNKNPVVEAKVDQGRSDYGKASIRNYRSKGPGYGEPAMFDPENKRGKLIDKRREEHKARRGVKGAKVPAYKREDVTLQDVDGKDRVQIIDIIKPEPMKSPKNNIMWNEEKMTKIINSVKEKKRKNALQIQKVIGT